MAENLIIAEGGKEQKYELLYKQIEALVKKGSAAADAVYCAVSEMLK